MASSISNSSILPQGGKRIRIRRSNSTRGSFRVANIGRAVFLGMVLFASFEGVTSVSTDSDKGGQDVVPGRPALRNLFLPVSRQSVPVPIPTPVPSTSASPTNTTAPSSMPSVSNLPSISPEPTVMAPTPVSASSAVPSMIPFSDWTLVPESALPSDGPSLTPESSSSAVPSSAPSASLNATGAPSFVVSSGSTDAASTTLVPTPTLEHSVSPTISSTTTYSKTPTPLPTKMPTVRPTTGQTVPPTSVPTITPIVTPTLVPTIAPTEESDVKTLTTVPNAPTVGWVDDDDFFSPVGLLPRQSPTPTRDIIVNQAPSVSLTSAPITNSPTELPTVAPSLAPTRNPTRTPTLSPVTMPPTSAPVPAPTNFPTPQPTTATPSGNPSTVPTPSPTRVPTRRPTLSPTGKPSQFPTFSPTLMPVTPNPTPSGTLQPTLFPTLNPSVQPSTSPEPSATPTVPPTALPSSIPSAAPSLPEQLGLVEAGMTLFPFLNDSLQGQAAIVWERETEIHIQRFILQSGIEPPLFDVEVSANIVDQYFPIIDASDESGRFLQTSDRSIIIQYDVSLNYRSEGDDIDLDGLVFAAWDSPALRSTYVSSLKARSTVFLDVDDVIVEVEGYVPPPDNAGDDGPSVDGGSNVAVIAGASVGGAALLLLVVFLFMRGGSNKSVNEENQGQTQANPDTATQGNKIAVSTEILVEPQDDISTLGDPMFAPGGMLMGGLDRDEATASAGGDYDYARQYRFQAGHAASISSRTQERSRMLSEDYTKSSSTNSVTMAKIGKMGDSLFADDASFEQQFAEPEERFDVVAPAGKLGMVIDTPNGGMPVVHAIKETSVLADRVRVGDLLLSVDGEDCTAMTAMQVSKLISLKSEKPARVLVFARSRVVPAGN